LFQPAFRSHYDLAVWVECSFETALERAIVRGQEGLPPDETVRAFESIYFPAERFHFERDDPKASADMILVNDPRLDPSGA
jgi:uridine kinase